MAQSDDQLVATVRETVEAARKDLSKLSIADASPEGVALEAQQAGVTIDLCRRQLAYLPDVVVEEMKDDILRLAISHNQLTGFPSRIGECSRLRYLNARNNRLRDFPGPVLSLSSLEILDISRNRLRTVPSDITRLTSLKVLAVSRNMIERLPVSIGEMSSLRVLKLDHNPLVFPPAQVCRPDTKAANSRQENEEVVTTTRVKRFLRDFANAHRQDSDVLPVADPALLGISPDTGRKPRRAAGTRFPVRPSLGGFEMVDSAGLTGSTTSSRTHFRDRSQQPVGRPSTSPGRPERPVESAKRSESVHSATLRSRRMGIVNDRAPDLSFFEGGTPSTATMAASTPAAATASPQPGRNELEELDIESAILTRLLAEPRPEMGPEDRLVLAANRAVFAHRQLGSVTAAVLRHLEHANRPGLEELTERLAEAADTVTKLTASLAAGNPADLRAGEVASHSGMRLQTQCRLAFGAAARLYATLSARSRDIGSSCPPGLLRTFVLSLFGVLMELRDAMAVIGISLLQPEVAVMPADGGMTMPTSVPTGMAVSQPHFQPHFQPQPFSTPPTYHPSVSSTTSLPSHPVAPLQPQQAYLQPQLHPVITHRGSQNTLPPHGSSVSSISASSSTTGQTQTIEDGVFAQLYVRLKSTTALAHSSVPELQIVFARERDALLQTAYPPSGPANASFWAYLTALADRLMGATSALGLKLQTGRVRDPTLRQQPAFWSLIRTYCSAWYDLVAGIQSPSLVGPLQSRVRVAMKPLHRANKDLILAIDQSPWKAMLLDPPPAAPPSIQPITTMSGPPISGITTTTTFTPGIDMSTSYDPRDFQSDNLATEPTDLSFSDLSTVPPDMEGFGMSFNPMMTVQTPMTSIPIPRTGSSFGTFPTQIGSPLPTPAFPSTGYVQYPSSTVASHQKPILTSLDMDGNGNPFRAGQTPMSPMYPSDSIANSSLLSVSSVLSANPTLINSQFPTRTKSLRR